VFDYTSKDIANCANISHITQNIT